VTAVAVSALEGSRQGTALTGTLRLLRFNLRRDRIRLPAWVAGIALLQISGASGYPGIYPTAADRQGQAVIMGENPAMKAMAGPGYGLDNYTFGAMMTNEYLGFIAIAVALLAVFTVVRHSRAEEETGRAELIRSSVVGRHANLTAALLTAAIASVTLGAFVALGMAGLGIESIDLAGSLLFGAAYAMVGLVFAGVAAITAQVSGFSRASSGTAGALVAVAYLLRAIGDVGDNWLRWLSPIGWAQATAAYVHDRWWPIGLGLAVFAGLCAVAFALSGRRDVGAGLRAQRAGPAAASDLLGTPIGFAWRLQRSSLLWWLIAMLLGSLAYGTAVDVIESYADNEVVQQIAQAMGGANLTESWLSMIIMILVIVCTIFSIVAALRPRREETSGRAESVLATAISRTQWVATHLAVAMLGGTGLLLVTGLGLGGGAALVSGEGHYVPEVVIATLVYTPALWATAALAVAVFGLLPRVIGLAWAVLGYSILIAYLGGLLDLPHWMFNLSPYQHIPRMPAAEFEALPLVILTGIAAVLVAAGLLGFRRRDVAAP
jgi:ABC-2 type transport system permease protein